MCPAGMSMAIIEALARAQHYVLIPEVTKIVALYIIWFSIDSETFCVLFIGFII